ncbi:MAG: class I SAM-dependent methyltransferase [Actinomycetota bacterium]|nr:class I SAM-dependent methyltransferase [Actinomycetota bacterium]
MSSRYQQDIDMSADNNTHTMLVRAVGTNKRVLELGAASGYMTRRLHDQGCTVVAVECDPEAADELSRTADRTVIGDLNDLAVLEGIDGKFDVVLAGDVLEHLLDPLGVLRAAVAKLASAGRVVISVPNVTHADLKVSLLAGHFDYRDQGLLDRTHIRFFTFETLMALLAAADLQPIEMQRMQIPMFHTELAQPPDSVGISVQAAALRVRESDTYQFIVTAQLVAEHVDAESATETFAHQQREAATKRATAIAEDRLSTLLGSPAPADPELTGSEDELRARIGGLTAEVAAARRELLDACRQEITGAEVAGRLHHLEVYQRGMAEKWAEHIGGDPAAPLDEIVEQVLASSVQELAAAREQLAAVREELAAAGKGADAAMPPATSRAIVGRRLARRLGR